MKTIVAISLVVLACLALATGAAADHNRAVSATFTLTDLGQGAGGGGTLFSDGSANGRVVVSALNGQVVAHLYPTSWSEVVPGETVDVCFHIEQKKGPPIFPPSLCLSELGIELPLSGSPVIIPNPRSDTDLLIRATATG